MKTKTQQQTHARIRKRDKTRLRNFMKLKNIRSEAEAIRLIFNAVRL